tara:strand:- start:315 stop:884 length:570 start_codon:yes stop_codon:yes gene_type:complete
MSLADHIRNNDLRNSELNALAKVRFIDEETQLAIAKQPYRRAKMHLASNENLSEDAREELWDHRGFSLKSDLVAAGHYVDDPQRYYDLFRNHSWGRSDWRLLRTFVRTQSWYCDKGARATPSDLLAEIYHYFANTFKNNQWGSYDWQLVSFAKHPNCDLDLALLMSTSTVEKIRDAAIERIEKLTGEAS